MTLHRDHNAERFVAIGNAKRDFWSAVQSMRGQTRECRRMREIRRSETGERRRSNPYLHGSADAEYGRAYAAAIPSAGFVLLRETGHLPQIETPEALATSIWQFADEHAISRPGRN